MSLSKAKEYGSKRRKRERAMRIAFVKALIRYPVKGVTFSHNYHRISLTFFGERISHKIIVKRERYIGAWSRKRDEIDVDKHFSTRDHIKSFRAICVHEAVEKYLGEKYGLHEDTEAHEVATAKERQYLRKIGGNWRSHQILVYRVWSLMNRR
jgi:hypothetical protein